MNPDHSLKSDVNSTLSLVGTLRRVPKAAAKSVAWLTAGVLALGGLTFVESWLSSRTAEATAFQNGFDGTFTSDQLWYKPYGDGYYSVSNPRDLGASVGPSILQRFTAAGVTGGTAGNSDDYYTIAVGPVFKEASGGADTALHVVTIASPFDASDTNTTPIQVFRNEGSRLNSYQYGFIRSTATAVPEAADADTIRACRTGRRYSGEIDQKTGHMYSVNEDYSFTVSGAAQSWSMRTAIYQFGLPTDTTKLTCVAAAAVIEGADGQGLNDQWSLATGENYTSAAWAVSSDMAIDANGNFYILLKGDATHHALVRLDVPRDSATGEPTAGAWTYRLVRAFQANATNNAKYGMAFQDGDLYTVDSTANFYRWDTLSGAVTNVGQPPTAAGRNLPHDLASAQTAPVIEGRVYNDLDGDGKYVQGVDDDLEGMGIEIYHNTNTAADPVWVKRGDLVTDSEGKYSALVNDATGEYIVRLKQPVIGGVNAYQTFARDQEFSFTSGGVTGGNTVQPYCAASDADYQLTPLSAADSNGWVDCYGARRDGTDPLTAAVGDMADPLDSVNGAAFVSHVEMNSSLAVVSADFGLSVAQSWGDAPAPYASTNSDSPEPGPYASPRRGATNHLYLGENAGVASDGAHDAEADAHAADDGLTVAPVFDGVVGDFVPAQGQIMAAGQSYRFRLKVSGAPSAVQASTAKAWITDVTNGAAATAFDTALLGGGDCSALPDAVNGHVECDYTAPALPDQGLVPVYVRARVSSVPDVTATSRPAPGATVQQYGEIEDYQLGVATSVARLQARTLGGVSADVGLSLTNVSSVAPSRTAAAIRTDEAKGFVAAVQAHAVVDRDQPVVITTDRVGAADATDLGGWSLTGRSTTGTYCWDDAGTAEDSGDRLPTTVDSGGRTLTVSPPAGGLPPSLTCRLTYVPRGDTASAWVTATPSDNEADPLRAEEGASRVRVNVAGTVRDATGAAVTLPAEGETVTLELEPRLGAPDGGARFESSPDGGTTWTAAGQTFDCHIGETGDCEAPVRVWGLAAGGHNLTARIGGTSISKKDGGVSAGDPVQIWFADDPADARSYMTVTDDPDQRANYAAPGVPSAIWGAQTIEVTLRDSANRAYQDGASRLRAVSPVDGGDGVRYATTDAAGAGVFVCATEPGPAGDCAAGVYTLVVHAETAGAKRIKVDYTADDPADSFAVKTLPLEPLSAREDHVVANFVTPPASAADSQFILNGAGQTNPEFDPTGAPVDHSVGFAYSPAVRTWDAGQRNPVPDASVRFTLSDPSSGSTCPGVFPGGAKTVTAQSGSDPALAGFGMAGVSLTSSALGACVITAEVLEDGVWRTVAGSPKTVTWVEDVPVDFTRSWFDVSTGDVVADEVATGTVRVKLVDENGYLITSRAGSILGRGPQGVAITVGSFVYDPVEEVYTAAFRGSKAGAHQITVTYSLAQALTKRAGGNDTARLIPGPADPLRTVESLVVGGTRQANGVAGVPAHMVVQDAFGNPISGHQASACGFQLSPAGVQTVWFGTQNARLNPSGGAGTGAGGVTGADGRCAVEARSFTPGQYMVVGSFGGQSSPGTADDHKAKFSDVTIDAANSWWSVVKSPVDAAAQQVVADGLDSWTVTINGRDVAGDVANIQDLRVEWKLGGALVGSAPVTTGVTGTTAPGVAVYQIKTTAAGHYEVSVWVGDDQVSTIPFGPVTTQNAQFVPGPAFRGTLTASSGPRLYTDTSAQSHSATVTVFDVNGNLAPGTPVTFVLDPTKAAHFVGLDGSNPCGSGAVADCQTLTWLTSQLGVAEVRVASSVSETTLVNTFLGVGAAGTATGSATFLFEDTDLCASCSTFQISPDPAVSSRVADGVQAFTGVVTVRTTSDVPAAAGFQVTFDVPDGLVVTGDDRTDSDGRVTVTFTTLVAKTYRVNAQIVGSDIPDADQELTFVPGPAVAARSFLDVSTENVSADGVASNRAWVVVRDANGNPITGHTVHWDIEPGSPDVAGPSLSAASAVTCDFDSAAKPAWCDMPGKAQITVVSGEPGVFGVHAYLDAARLVEVAASPKQLQFGAGEPDPSRSKWTVTPDAGASAAAVVADGSDHYTVDVEVRSSANILVDGATVRLTPVGGAGLTVSPGTGAVSTGTPTAPVWGHFAWSVSSTVRGAHIAWVEVWTSGAWTRIGDPVTLRFAGGPADASRSWLVQPGATVVDGSAQATVSARLFDGYDNPADSGTVVFHVPAGLTATAGGVAHPGPVDVEVPVATGAASVTVSTLVAATYVVTADVKGSPNAHISLVKDVGESTAVDTAGRVRVTFTDVTPPGEPVVDPSDGRHVTGAVDPSDLEDAKNGDLAVVVIDPRTGGEVARCPVKADGSFDCPVVPALPDGAEVVVAIVDAASNVSDHNEIVVDATPPEAPGSKPSSGEELSGSGDPGDTILVEDEAGAVICETQVDPSGTWRCELEPTLKTGDVVTIIELDPAKNQVAKPWRIGLPAVTVAKPSLAPGEEQAVTGVNFQPGETVTAAGVGAPATAALAADELTADADGQVVFRWQTPKDAAPGEHVVTLSGPLSGSYQAEYMVVLEPEPVLPFTGADGLVGKLGGALGLLIAGVWLVAAARRRVRRPSHALG